MGAQLDNGGFASNKLEAKDNLLSGTVPSLA
jgi:hypothetical protein